METQEIFTYQDPNGREARCGLEIQGPRVILTELDDNPGMSVVNAIATLASQVLAKYLPLQEYPPQDIIWIESNGEDFCQVKFDYIILRRSTWILAQARFSPYLFQ